MTNSMAYRMAKTLIRNHNYQYDDMLDKLGVLFLNATIEQEQYDELVGMMVNPNV